MKSLTINLYTRSVHETYAIISQIKDKTVFAFADSVTNASKLNNNTVSIKLANLDKKQAIQALRDLIKIYRYFRVNGNVCYYTNPITGKEVKLISLPLTPDTAQQTLDKLNKDHRLKLSLEDIN